MLCTAIFLLWGWGRLGLLVFLSFFFVQFGKKAALCVLLKQARNGTFFVPLPLNGSNFSWKTAIHRNLFLRKIIFRNKGKCIHSDKAGNRSTSDPCLADRWISRALSHFIFRSKKLFSRKRISQIFAYEIKFQTARN